MSRICKLSGHKTMLIAEKLYNNGYISYPRTETDRYPSNFDFESVVGRLEGDRWVGDCISLFKSQGIQRPRQGKNDDKAHPPIHPLKPGNDLSGDEARVFEYIVRRFAAGVAKDALLHETTITCNVGMEQFSIKGETIVEENYLLVFIYDRLQTKVLPKVNQGQRLAIREIKRREGETSAPLLLAESDLINIMDKNGIGTDATIHEHIQKVLDRGYAVKSNDRFVPTALGVGLVVGYDLISPDLSLTKPKLRAELEQNLQKICEASIGSAQVKTSYLNFFKTILENTLANFEHIYGCVSFYTTNSGLMLPSPEARQPNTREGNKDMNSGNHRRVMQSGKTRGGKRSKATQERIVKLPNTSNSYISAEDSEDVRCECGLIAIQLVSKKEGSAGKKFLTCGKKVYKCKFFKWVDN